MPTAQANLAAVDIATGDLQGALRRYAVAEPVLRAAGAHGVLVPILNNRWQVHMHLGDTASAIADLVAGAASAGVVGAVQQQHQMLSKAVELLYGTGRNTEAEPVWADLEEACRQLGDQAGLQRAVGERALLLIGRNALDDAAPLLDEQEQICRAIGDQVGLAACVGNRAILLRQRGDLAGSLACIDEQLALARASGNGQGVLFATANRGEVLGAMGRIPEGLAAIAGSSHDGGGLGTGAGGRPAGSDDRRVARRFVAGTSEHRRQRSCRVDVHPADVVGHVAPRNQQRVVLGDVVARRRPRPSGSLTVGAPTLVLALGQTRHLVVRQLDNRRAPTSQWHQRVAEQIEIRNDTVDTSPAGIALVIGELVPRPAQIRVAARCDGVGEVLLVDRARQLLARSCIHCRHRARALEEGEDPQVAAARRGVSVDQRAEARLGACAHHDRCCVDAQFALSQQGRRQREDSSSKAMQTHVGGCATRAARNRSTSSARGASRSKSNTVGAQTSRKAGCCMHIASHRPDATRSTSVIGNSSSPGRSAHACASETTRLRPSWPRPITTTWFCRLVDERRVLRHQRARRTLVNVEERHPDLRRRIEVRAAEERGEVGIVEVHRATQGVGRRPRQVGRGDRDLQVAVHRRH